MSPLFMDAFLSTIVNSFATQAMAESNGQITARNYVNLMMPGAPMRYIFDHWLKTSSSDISPIFNAMTGNSYTYSGDTVSGVEAKYLNYNNVLVPHLYSQTVQLSNGPAKISNLLDNMLVMRGYATGIDGHSANSMKQMAPLGGVPSLTGLVADNSKRIFEAIQSPARGQFSSFVSTKGKALNILPISDPLKTLMVGFGKPKTGIDSRPLKERNAEAFDKAKRNLASKAGANNLASQILNSSLSNAEAMMKKGISNLDEALPRYQKVITDAIRTLNIDSISQKPIVANSNLVLGDSDSRFNWGIQSGDIYLFGPDYDMRDAIANSSIAYFAEGLAMAEYVINENLAQSVEIMSGGLSNFVVPFLRDPATGYKTRVGPTGLELILDMHATGSHTNVFAFNAYYRGIAAGLLELISKLKAKNTFANTVIQTTCDFGRSARTAGTGSDHGFNQMISSVIGGCFTGGPYVVGNVLKTGHNDSYNGTQGIAAPISNYNQKGRPTPLAPASTVAELLSVDHNPYSNLAAPLVKIKNGKLEYEFGKGAIVEPTE
jgi:hypothetical protein